jgi:hypothetical protein
VHHHRSSCVQKLELDAMAARKGMEIATLERDLLTRESSSMQAELQQVWHCGTTQDSAAR